MLVKLTPGVNFTGLLAHSANVSVVIFWCQPSFFCAVQFHQLNYGHLCQYIQLENTLNFYTLVCPALYTGKFGVNLLAQKLLVEHWWNWLQVSNCVGMFVCNWNFVRWTLDCSTSCRWNSLADWKTGIHTDFLLSNDCLDYHPFHIGELLSRSICNIRHVEFFHYLASTEWTHTWTAQFIVFVNCFSCF